MACEAGGECLLVIVMVGVIVIVFLLSLSFHCCWQVAPGIHPMRGEGCLLVHCSWQLFQGGVNDIVTVIEPKKRTKKVSKFLKEVKKSYLGPMKHFGLFCL